ncbi:MAG: polysaccharide biosynthesis protein [Pyrinomonadaceae bacterium]|jgi:FlaA1/EpsC-like NDP-sugar epimerase|nr:polysaccharide biosynthesis protein [Pyrinomonadaceae bacterium]
MKAINQKAKNILRLRGNRGLVRQLQFAVDLTILVGAFVLAYLLRFDFVIPRTDIFYALIQLPYVVLIQFAVLFLTGVYTFIWRYVGMAELKAFLRGALWSVLPVITLRVSLPEEFQQWRVPLSVIVVDTFFAFGGVLGVRLMWRALYEQNQKHHRAPALGAANGHKRRVLLIGAGRAGMLAAKEIQNRGDSDMKIIGFVDDDPNKQRAVIQGIKVLGVTEDLPHLVRELKIKQVVISLAQASRQDFRRILDICEQSPVKVQIIPAFYEILEGKLNISRIRDVQIEDLLGREAVRLDEEGVRRFVSGKTVMITGAGGSIGSELGRQLARFTPSCLLLVDRSEFGLFTIDRELRDNWPELSLMTLVADVGDRERMHAIFATHLPHVVIHAAAHKHVPMMESNPGEAVKNNVFGTRELGDLAGEFGVDVFVLVSTDKAVRPTSIMGATKRLAELVVQDLNRRFATHYVAVRFGNVIGSAGSVVPVFREQIRKGGPVTVTHPDMIRYFMTIPEAAQLVLQAGAIGQGGEIFILNMGEPVCILDLAKEIIALSGLRPFDDIDIVFTGLRPGEKLFEELETSDEQIVRTRHPKIFIGKIAAYPEGKVCEALERLRFLSKDGEERELRRYLNALLPEARLVECVGDVITPAEVSERPLDVGAIPGG